MLNFKQSSETGDGPLFLLLFSKSRGSFSLWVSLSVRALKVPSSPQGVQFQSLIYIINIDGMDLGLAGWSLSVPSGSLSCAEVFVKTAFRFLKLQDLRAGF